MQIGGQEGIVTAILQIIGSDNVDMYVLDASLGLSVC